MGYIFLDKVACVHGRLSLFYILNSCLKKSQILDNVAFVHCWRALSCVCRCFPQVALGHQHAAGGDENDDDDDEDDDEDDDDDDDDEVSTKKFFKFLHIRPHKDAWCQLLAVGTTPCAKGFYY